MKASRRNLLVAIFYTISLVIGTILPIWTASPALAITKQTFTNPIRTGADPGIWHQNGYYYYVETQGNKISVKKAESFVDLADSFDVVVWRATSGTSTCCEVWAPEIRFLNGRWYIYFTADDGSDATHRLYVLESTSADPQGDYIFKGQIFPTDAPNSWAIDPFVFQTADGSMYITWSGRSSTTMAGSQAIFIDKLSNPWTMAGSRVMLSVPNYSWEQVGGKVNEAPSVLQKNGRTFIIYSASSFTTSSYALGFLSNSDGNLLNAASWSKRSTPLFSSANGVYGPGSNTFTKSPDGKEDWIIYHARATTDRTDRTIRAQKISWSSNGFPILGTPVATTTALALPSGDSIGDLTIKQFALTDANGNVKSTFAPGEAIYPKVTIANTGYRSVYVRDGLTVSQFYANAASTVTTNTVSDVGVDLHSGQFGGGQVTEYAAYPGGTSANHFADATNWSKATPGTYTARVNVNFDAKGSEGDYSNNQAIVRYTISGSITPTPTPTPASTPQPTPLPTPTPLVNGTDVVISKLELTDSNGLVKTSFKINQPIYIKVTYVNLGNKSATSSDGLTYSIFFKNQATAVALNAHSDPANFYTATGNLAAGSSKTYASYPTSSTVSAFAGTKSWTMGATGTYTARGFIDYDGRIAETDNNNNQATVKYTVTQ